MRIKLQTQLLIILPLLFAACAPGTGIRSDSLETAARTDPIADSEMPTASASSILTAATVPTDDAEQLEPVILPVSVYIIEDAGDELSSDRSVEELESVLAQANEIWSPAAIRLDVHTIERITLPADIVQAIAAGNFGPFFDGVGRNFQIPDPSLINAFYARSIGGPNGIVPFGARLFFVADEPTVHDERVTSHEIGHILGLYHTLKDNGRLMFPGTNGMSLTEEEIVVARYGANGLIYGVR